MNNLQPKLATMNDVQFFFHIYKLEFVTFLHRNGVLFFEDRSTLEY